MQPPVLLHVLPLQLAPAAAAVRVPLPRGGRAGRAAPAALPPALHPDRDRFGVSSAPRSSLLAETSQGGRERKESEATDTMRRKSLLAELWRLELRSCEALLCWEPRRGWLLIYTGGAEQMDEGKADGDPVNVQLLSLTCGPCAAGRGRRKATPASRGDPRRPPARGRADARSGQPGGRWGPVASPVARFRVGPRLGGSTAARCGPVALLRARVGESEH